MSFSKGTRAGLERSTAPMSPIRDDFVKSASGKRQFLYSPRPMRVEMVKVPQPLADLGPNTPMITDLTRTSISVAHSPPRLHFSVTFGKEQKISSISGFSEKPTAEDSLPLKASIKRQSTVSRF